jgi:hypothetical protein
MAVMSTALPERVWSKNIGDLPRVATGGASLGGRKPLPWAALALFLVAIAIYAVVMSPPPDANTLSTMLALP